jgi:hypothetical protein
VAIEKATAHLCLPLIVKELKIGVEQGRVVTTLNILCSVLVGLGNHLGRDWFIYAHKSPRTLGSNLTYGWGYDVADLDARQAAIVAAHLSVLSVHCYWYLTEGHFAHEPRALTMKLWEPKRKCPQRPSQHTLQIHVLWSRILECSVKSYVTGPSTKCYFNECLFMRVFTHD